MCCCCCFFFFFNDTATTEIYTLSLHDALPICTGIRIRQRCVHIFVCVGCLGWDGMALTQRDFLVFPVCPTNSHCVVTDDCNCKVKATSCVFETENKLVLWNNCRSLADAYIICCLFLSGSRWL